MRPFLLLATRADDEPADAEYEAFLLRTGLDASDLVRCRLEAGPMPRIDLEDYSGILVGGSPFNTTTVHKSATQQRVEAEFDALLDRVVAEDFPFLGACYGIGTLARHQGAHIDSTYAEEVDAPEITLTPQGLADPLCAGMAPAFRAFVAHNDAITVAPPHMVVLATSPSCPVQMMRVKDNLYATQFHPELDGEFFAHRQGFYADHGYFDPEALPEIQAWTRAQDVSGSWHVLRNFVERYAR
ncbi:glutamine amidotransferase [Actinomyces sp. HMT897]|uniref:glutamine amidotransferase n=1 Tax=Actinomyces sp. HMT897 TaxID=2789424 RepID=UPI00190E4703|nr:glutamine amidotransferase [Actinomyces sp. HMT897]QQO76994.1 glutamine amidotransferase [Actinomyces sp. HMT897]